MIPKKANVVTVNGQCSTHWPSPFQGPQVVPSQAGDHLIADKKAVFVIRADGSVLSAKTMAGVVLG
jgi:hypothetical protein